MKIRKGDKIALLGKNNSNWGITYIASITYGAVIVPILPDFKPKDMTHIINHSDSKLLFVSDAIFEQLDLSDFCNIKVAISLDSFSILETMKKSYNSRYDKALNYKATDLQLILDRKDFAFDISDGDLAELVYTSGTTGFSKGVMLPHRSLRANVEFAVDTLPVKSGDPIVSFLPLAHAYGCAFEFLYPFSIGAHITFLSKIPSPKIILKAFADVKPRLILSVPLVIEKIYNKQIKPVLDQPKMKLLTKIPIVKNIIYKKICDKLTLAFGGNFLELIIGGAPLNKDVDRFLKLIGFKYLIGYGMSECGPLISYETPSKYKVGTVGKAIPCVQVRIDKANDFGIGEIQVKGLNVMDGYYKNKEATKATFTQDNWLKTGDLGSIDSEGNISIRGRSKSMLLGPSGQNIYPEEIEATINNLPFVSESLVIQREGKLIALVYPDFDKVDKLGLDEVKLKKKFVQERNQINSVLPSYSTINVFEIVSNEFEKTPTKKIKRFMYK